MLAIAPALMVAAVAYQGRPNLREAAANAMRLANRLECAMAILLRWAASGCDGPSSLHARAASMATCTP